MEVEQTLFLSLAVKRQRASRNVALRAKRALKKREAFRRHQAQQRMLFTLALCSCAVQLLVPPRMVWAHEQLSEWCERIVNGTFTAHDWLTNFRMSQATFDYICVQLQNEIERSNTVMRSTRPVQVRVAITVRYLATDPDYHTIGHLLTLGAHAQQGLQ